MSLSKDKVVAIVFILLSIFVIVDSQKIVIPQNISEPGGALFPMISGIGMLICAIGIFFTKQPENDKKFLDKDGWKRMGIIFVALIIYFLALNYIGFLVSTPFCLYGFIHILKSGRKVNPVIIAIVSIVTTLILYYSFTKGFAIALPTGKLF